MISAGWLFPKGRSDMWILGDIHHHQPAGKRRHSFSQESCNQRITSRSKTERSAKSPLEEHLLNRMLTYMPDIATNLYWRCRVICCLLLCCHLSRFVHLAPFRLLCCVAVYCTLLYTTIQYCTLLYTIGRYCTLLYTTVHYCTLYTVTVYSTNPAPLVCSWGNGVSDKARKQAVTHITASY